MVQLFFIAQQYARVRRAARCAPSGDQHNGLPRSTFTTRALN
jgi:hypothetical protein